MRYYLFFFGFCFLMACKRKWTEKEKTEFVAGCMKGAVRDMGEEKARLYCDCLLKKLVIRYPNANDVQYLKYDTAIVQLARECLKQP